MLFFGETWVRNIEETSEEGAGKTKGMVRGVENGAVHATAAASAVHAPIGTAAAAMHTAAT